jgi:DNA-binding LacI/PurR family transcriptional regulator
LSIPGRQAARGYTPLSPPKKRIATILADPGARHARPRFSALPGNPLISQETAARIRRIADKAGYLPSAVGRSLVTCKTNTIGMVVTTISDPVMTEVVSGIETAANGGGYSVFLAHSYAEAERRCRATFL